MNGANHLTWRLLALLAKDRLEMGSSWILQTITAVISVDAQPMHHAVTFDLLFTHDRNVIFRLTGEDTRIAADTRIEIDRHSPLMVLFINSLMLFVGVHRHVVLILLMTEVWIFVKSLEI